VREQRAIDGIARRMSDTLAPHGEEPDTLDLCNDSEGKENEQKPTADEIEDESDSKLPAPLANGAYRKMLKELPDGPRIAAETCVQFWKVLLLDLDPRS